MAVPTIVQKYERLISRIESFLSFSCSGDCWQNSEPHSAAARRQVSVADVISRYVEKRVTNR
jgi:hypothetical protein